MTVRAEDVDPNLVSPGIGAFVTFFVLALVVILIARSFTVHMRRIKARAALDEKAAGREGAADSGDGAPGLGTGDRPAAGAPDGQNGDTPPTDRT
ncbi:hypothetical protein [Ruania halotolerans]|uniref:hypothetical protein n=1 Tax=Ruania halotolerans TaxID=2897773 RepID=UPI001E579025|nr:hypothetical protein [Ruania halotolerans]UFU07448.1 hypothetical protein LQF10_04910 [Ruania halotolerans]